MLRPNGSAAWIERDPFGPDTLHRRDSSGEAVLATGELTRLALSERSTLYWPESGMPRSAQLAPAGAPTQGSRPTQGSDPWVHVVRGV